MLRLQIRRFHTTENYAIGRCTVGGVLVCYTVEPAVREVQHSPVSEWKVWGATAVPSGEYEFFLSHNQHTGTDLPTLNRVPGFSNVSVYPNEVAHDGRIVPALFVGNDGTPHRSADAFGILMSELSNHFRRGLPVKLEIVNG